MNGENSFVRLNKIQRAFLRAIEPWDNNSEFFGKLEKGDIVILGYSSEKCIVMIGELERAGYLTRIYNPPGVERDPITGIPVNPMCFTLSSDAFCYWYEYGMNLVLPVFLQLIAGSAGGLAVWLLTHLFFG